jgi:Ala-tRNA(Pro) deacylase
MAIAIKLKQYLEDVHVKYDVIQHPYSDSSMHTAEQAHISGENIAKGVLLHDDTGYILAIVPATHKVRLGKLHKKFDRYLSLADESDIGELFDDCSIGAIPPVGMAYDMDVIYDDTLNKREDIYFEAGDHTSLVHVSRDDFRTLLEKAPHGKISRHM